MNGQKVWASILSDVKNQVSTSTFKTWFSGSHVLDFKEGDSKKILVVGLKSSFLKEQVESRYRDLIEEATIRKGFSNTSVSFVVSSREKTKEDASPAPLFSGEAPVFINSFKKTDNINHLHTFDSFVVGPSNNIAFLAFAQASEKPGNLYNPLFIFGETGVGKTHLLHSFGNDVLNKFSDAKVLYVSSEKFTNDYIESLNNRTQVHFRNKYRNVDVLLIDDVQFLAGKESTQDEFFYTFNELFLSGKQIVLACDRHPKDLGRLKERLVSRFLGGMTVDISNPDLELRIAILKSKCKEKGVVLSSEILTYIAESSNGSVRELEGLLVQALSLTKLASGKISSDDLKRVVDKNKRVVKDPPTPGKVIDTVSKHFRISKEDLCGLRRKSSIVYARQILMYLLRLDLKLPLDSIGELLGGRDHSTVIYGVDKVEGLASKSQGTRDEISRIRSSFQQI
jgi:chromosomal replication initiator protein